MSDRTKDTDIALLEQSMEQVREELGAQRKTLDEQSRSLNDIKIRMVSIDATLSEINRRLARGDQAIDAVPELIRRIDELEARDRERKANQTWLWRTLVGGVIAASLPGVFMLLKAVSQATPMVTKGGGGAP